MVSFYTRERGRIELVAKGVKKSVSKNSPFLEPGMLVEIAYARGKQFDYLTTTHSRQQFAGVRQDLAKRLALGYVLSVMHQATREEKADPRIFDLFLSWMEHLDQAAFAYPYVDSFLLKLYALLGYAPSFGACVETDDPAVVAFSPVAGGMVSARTANEKKALGEPVYPCRHEDVLYLRSLLAASWGEIGRLVPSQQRSRSAGRVIHAFIEYQAEKKVPRFRTIISRIGSLR